MTGPDTVLVGVVCAIPLVGLALYVWFDLRMARLRSEMFRAEMEYYRLRTQRLHAYDRVIRNQRERTEKK